MSLKHVLASLAVAIAAGVGSPVAAAQDDPRLASAESWAFAIGNGMLGGDAQTVGDRLGAHDLVVVDAEEATPREVAELHERGVTVLGYMSVGTIENWRGWYPRVKRFRLQAWKDWKGEWFADTSRRRYRQIIAGKIAPRLLGKGFDGLFLDAVDMIEPDRHAKQRRGMRLVVKRLARLTGRRNAVLFAQNGFWGMTRFGIAKHLDGWNREDVTWTWDFDRERYVKNSQRRVRVALDELAKMRARGLFVTATDYTRRGDGEAAAESIANACSVGALPYVSNLGLTVKRLPDPPLTCAP